MINLKDQAKSIVINASKSLSEQGYAVTAPVLNNYNYEIKISLNNNSVKYLVYFGNKGIKQVLQGNNEQKFYKDVRDLVFGYDLFNQSEANISEPEKYIGTDESGKGDYFGPLVICGVFVNEESGYRLKELGVKDSKQLNDEKIFDLSKKIRAVINDNFEIVMINPEKYNLLYSKFENLNKLLAWGHSKVIENLLHKVDCNNIICDKFGRESLILNALQDKGSQKEIYQTHNAERFTAVAAASILARNRFLFWMRQKEKELKIKLVKGSSEKVEQVSNEILSKFGEEKLKTLVKWHFKTSKKLDKNN
ncbi:MAG: ribonuclease HIII [Ignavibacteriaceae bacterium]|nr:ribonuclease HIII [Ignavibacteriaceae bacterium]